MKGFNQNKYNCHRKNKQTNKQVVLEIIILKESISAVIWNHIKMEPFMK